MDSYSTAAVERAMKVQEVILRALAKKITWWQAAEIIGISDRSMRRWHQRYEEFGYDALFERRQKADILTCYEHDKNACAASLVSGHDLSVKPAASLLAWAAESCSIVRQMTPASDAG